VGKYIGEHTRQLLERPRWISTSNPTFVTPHSIDFSALESWKTRAINFRLDHATIMLFFFCLFFFCYSIAIVELEHAIILMYSTLGLMNVNWHVSSPLAISFYPRLHASKMQIPVYTLYIYVYISALQISRFVC